MTFGFRIFKADGVTVQIDSDSIGILFIDDFTVAAASSVTKTYAGLAGTTLSVIANGNNVLNSGATITQAVVGADKQVTVSVNRPGRFKIMME